MLSSADLEPLWRSLNDAAAFLFLHPGEGCDARLDPFYLHNLLGNPHETGLAAAHLVFSGVLGRFPGLTICLAHAGGSTPALAGRWQHGYDTARPGLNLDHEAPQLTLRRLCADCIAHAPAALDAAFATFGEQNILFGSDWPFPMGLLRPQATFASLTAERRQAVARDNAERLLSRRTPTAQP